MNNIINISVGNAAVTALMGYAVVFIGIIMLMILLMFIGRLMVQSAQRAAEKAAVAAAAAPAAEKPKAPGTAGELMLYDTDPRVAAMIMAIVADELGKPLNELRFKSIREVRENEI